MASPAARAQTSAPDFPAPGSPARPAATPLLAPTGPAASSR
ncbi:MAG: hypothetical protein WKG07_34330 [Hymenobacter sp.]